MEKSISARPNSDLLSLKVSYGVLTQAKVAEMAIKWMSDEEVGRMMNANGLMDADPASDELSGNGFDD